MPAVAEGPAAEPAERGEWFPGYAPRRLDLSRSAGPFAAGDEERPWVLDFHWPQGLPPLGLTTFVPTYVASSRRAARVLALPGGGGIDVRLVGPHLYVSPHAVSGPERARGRGAPVGATERARGTPGAAIDGSPAAVSAVLERRLETFPLRWKRRQGTLDRQFATLISAPPPSDAGAAVRLLRLARDHERWAWQVHFEEMYTLLAGHLSFLARVGALGIERELAEACLAGYQTRTWEALEALADLAARAANLDTEALARAVEDLLARHGQITEGIADVSLASWAEQPEIVWARLEMLEGRGSSTPSHADDELRRQEALEIARERASDRRSFEVELSRARMANWVWWNEEHNAYIDMRATIPLRRVARSSAAVLGLEPEQVLLLAWEELTGALRGGALPEARVLSERERWLEGWRARRGELPQSRGSGFSSLGADPIFAEVFGLTGDPPGGIGGRAEGGGRCVLEGVAASPGCARGVVRVLRSAAELGRLQPGEILVCEGTSPNWAPAFAVAAAVVCEHGGYTTHAAICAREYSRPCVVGVQQAMSVLTDGQEVEVDGETGLVRVVR